MKADYIGPEGEVFLEELAAREAAEEFARKKFDLVLTSLGKILPHMSLEQLLDIWDSYVGGELTDEQPD